MDIRTAKILIGCPSKKMDGTNLVDIGNRTRNNAIWIKIINTGRLSYKQLQDVKNKAEDQAVKDEVDKMIEIIKSKEAMK